MVTGKVEALYKKAANKKINLGITDKEFMKDAIDSAESGSSIMSKLKQLKTVTEDSREEGLTTPLSYKRDQLITSRKKENQEFRG